MFALDNIKLVIWDLDDTFWTGTLSEGAVTPIDRNIQLVKTLTDYGIINSICSKNDEGPTISRLSEMGVADLFVFKSINWQPKGQRISKMIQDMGLRPVNCLFIDDNPVNLNEASHYVPQLMTASPEIIGQLIQALDTKGAPSDPGHKRLRQYQVLEQKCEARSMASDNLSFLYDSQTQVMLHDDCLAHLDRIYELVNRTNQLNFTKLRSGREDLEALCTDPEVNCGYVTVSDRFGDYGIVGFYSIRDNECIHLLFSCRTIGQGVEQFVYAKLGHPHLTIVGDVVNRVDNSPCPAWINQLQNSTESETQDKTRLKVIIKGGCDLKSISTYIKTNCLIEEFTHISPTRHNNIENESHSTNYLTLDRLSNAQRQMILDECIFAAEDMFGTSMYDDDVALIIISTMSEPNLGIYRHKQTGIRIAWGEYMFPLTDRKNWDGYVSGQLFAADNQFTIDWLEQFSRNWEFCGRLTPEQVLGNIKELMGRISPNAKLCLMLGSETPYEKNTQPNYKGRHNDYGQINALLRDYAANNDRLLLVDFNNYIHGQADFTNNINHFVRRVYFDAATQINRYIADITGKRLEQKSRLYMQWKSLADRIGKTGLFQTKFYGIIRRPYMWLYKRLVREF